MWFVALTTGWAAVFAVQNRRTGLLAMGRTTIDLTEEHGWFFLSVLALVLQQALVFVIPVSIKRRKTGIKPPVLYPTDSLIKELKLSKEDVEKYLCTQRVHQNNVEFLVTFWPVYFLCGLVDPLSSAYAGAVVFAGRMFTAIGYWHGANKRVIGAWFHIPEYYLYFTLGKISYNLITSAAGSTA